ncbi:hypothetical protein C7974DRAFT_456983 [Boeremia exigua]|uniref:uncharacterized protein n=1 Tax=Boeremia exigua TaxID=749465 RepID=UPI001E8E584C|nr:uncharacterized protein C7974DRAFT_456983 [Boeremia exigua]KAH6622076.1 hypothetical protein C7974DRAFT_456983 [Boeremia exigua]
MATQRTEFSDEELEKFQEFYDLAEGDIEVEFEYQCDLFDQYFPTPEKAGDYNDWYDLYKEKERALQFPSATRSQLTEPVSELITAAPLDTYKSRLANTDFNNIHDVAGLNDLMNCGFHPHIPVGYTQETKKVAFRLVPTTTILYPTKETAWNHGPDTVITPPMFLGINHTVILNEIYGDKEFMMEEIDAVNRYLHDGDEHGFDFEGLPEDENELLHCLIEIVDSFSVGHNRFGKYGKNAPVKSSTQKSPGIDYASSSASEGSTVPLDEVPSKSSARRIRDFEKSTEESTRTGDSDSTNDHTGFVFYQLGRLQFCESLPDVLTTDKDVIHTKHWESTEYVLVAEVGFYGKLGAVWLLWNFWLRDGDGDYWSPPWENFPGTRHHFSGARIADCFDQLGVAREIKIPKSPAHRFTEDFELVGCFRLPDDGNRLVRQWVVDRSVPRQRSSAT